MKNKRLNLMQRNFYIKPRFKLVHIFFCVLLCTNLPAQIITKGVSIELAKWRKQTISNVIYNLQFNIPVQKDSLVNGNESLLFSLKQNEQPVQIDFKGNANQIITITANKKNIPVNYINEHIIINNNYLISGKNEVLIQFIAGNQSLNRNENYLYTLLVPDRARTVFPCFDQPDIKAIFNLTLTIPKDWEASANGVLKDSALNDKSKAYHFADSDTISTYLFSFVAGKFFKAEQNCDRIMNFLYRETDTTKVNNSIPAIFQTQCDAIKFLEQYTDMPFPFQKFDFVAIPSFQFGGMEHVGNIYYHASTLFLNKGATQNQINNRINVLAHETSHMWFGDLVTMKWFDDVWVKEVYAQFMGDKIAQKELPSQNFQLLFITQHYPFAYSIDRTAGANPIHQPLENLEDAGTLYGNIIYDKASIMMKQLEMLIGKDTLMFGLRKYLKRYAFGNASWDELINILQKCYWKRKTTFNII
jgi:aminopeptidase N